jgi:hypothetical protein
MLLLSAAACTSTGMCHCGAFAAWCTNSCTNNKPPAGTLIFRDGEPTPLKQVNRQSEHIDAKLTN